MVQTPGESIGSSIQQGWREQFDRMQRSYVRLIGIAEGRTPKDSSTARDALFHFFQDAYHLKDWLINDQAASLPPGVVEKAVSGSAPLSICADLCNGTKHRSLARAARTGDRATAFTGQSVTIQVGSLAMLASLDLSDLSGPEGFATHSWQVTSNGKSLDAVALAGQVVVEWESWLVQQGLLDSSE